MNDKHDGCTFGELVKQVEALDRLVETKFHEREKFSSERDLRYAEKWSSSEKAVTKAYEAQQHYQQTHNDLVRKMEDMIPRREADFRFGKLEDAIHELQVSRGNVEGKSAGISSAWAMFIAVAGLIGGGGIVGLLLELLRK